MRCSVSEGPTCVGPQGRAHTGAPLQDLKHLILEKTEGTPFFMEEMVQKLVEQGVLVANAVATATHVPTYQPRCIFRPPSKACSPPVSTASRQTRKPCSNSSR